MSPGGPSAASSNAGPVPASVAGALMAGYVVAEAEVPERAEGSDTARLRVTIDASVGCEELEQRVICFTPGRSFPREPGEGREEALMVISGAGDVLIGGERHPVGDGTAVYVAAGERYEVDNPGPDELKLVSVGAPANASGGVATGRRKVTVDLAEQEARDATTQREFRCLVDPEVGCPSLTQFVGYIPKVRAPIHYHHYDEVIYVLDGEGLVQIGERTAAMGAGTCIHLPPRQHHRLENTGAEPMRVLGVFRPAGDPSAAYEA